MNLSEEEARRRLGIAPVARLATVSAGVSAGVSATVTATVTAAVTTTVRASGPRPHIVPVTFAVAGDRIFSAIDAKPKTGRTLQRLRNIRANDHVAVLADHYEDDWSRLWWVRADGRALVLDDPDEIAGPVRLLIERYPQYRDQPPAGPVICVTVQRWTGWAAGG